MDGDSNVCGSRDGEMEQRLSDQTIAASAKNVEDIHNWSKLPVEVKMMVVSYLNHTTRTKLSFCSKHDYDVVNQTPIKIIEVDINDDDENFNFFCLSVQKGVCVRIKFGDEDEDKQHNLLFIKRENDTEMMWNERDVMNWPVFQSVMLENCDYYEKAVKLMEKLLKQSRYSVESLIVRMKNYPFEKSKIQRLPQCKKLELTGENESELKWWLDRVTPNLNYLELPNHTSKAPISSKLLDMEHKWINGEVRREFVYFTIKTNRRKRKNTILKGISFTPWSNDFEWKEFHFCRCWKIYMGSGACYQIKKGNDPWTSATLSIGRKSITFGVTGFRSEREHIVETIYKYPY